jgi:hypothetical protein
MTTLWARTSALAFALALSSAFVAPAQAERWPGSTASIGGAIAARIIAVKCNRPMHPNSLTPAEIVELDKYIDEQQTAFMSGSKANQRFGVSVFPILARDYDRTYSSPDACTNASREMAKDMLQRVRTQRQAALNQ